MPLQVAVQMDPIERVNIETDTTFMLMLEAQARGHGLWVYAPDHLALEDGRVLARGRAAEPARRSRATTTSLGRCEVPRPLRVRRGADAPGPAVRHGLHHRHLLPGDASTRRPWW